MENRCQQCGKLFIHKYNLIRHNVRMHIAEKTHTCRKCDKTFHSEYNKFLHERHCNKIEYSHSNSLKRKKLVSDYQQPCKKTKSSYNICITKTAFKNAAVTYAIKYHDDKTSFIQEINESVDVMSSKIIDFQKLNKALKFNMALHVIFEKSTSPEIKTDPPVCLVSEQLEAYTDTNLSKLLVFVKKQLIDQIDTYEQHGSGWILYKLTRLQLSVWKLNPLRGKTFQSLPLWVQNKHAVVNVRNEDNKCFQWSVLAALHEPRSTKEQKNLVSCYRK